MLFFSFNSSQSIRETWGNVTEFNYSFFKKMHSNFELGDCSKIDDVPVKIVFLVGQTQSYKTQVKLNTESGIYGDLIQESFLDTYYNLTLKTVMMMKWVNANCKDKGEIKCFYFFIVKGHVPLLCNFWQ